MTCHLLVEGATDALLVKKVLRREVRAIPLRIWESGGKGSANSLARSILIARREPVIVLLDADNTRQPEISEQRRYLESSLGQVSSSGQYRICLAVPEVEGCLFEVPGLVQCSTEDMIRARYEPKQVLHEVLARGGATKAELEFVSSLKGRRLLVLRETSIFKEVLNAIHELTAVHELSRVS